MKICHNTTASDSTAPPVEIFGRRLFHSLKRTPLHPQWIALRGEELHLRAIAGLVHGRVLEIGSGDRRLEKYLRAGTRYIGLDYPPSGQRYSGRPDVWADAACLPFRESTMDGVVMLEVLEHLPDPRTALMEASRVVTPIGLVLLSSPFFILSTTLLTIFRVSHNSACSEWPQMRVWNSFA